MIDSKKNKLNTGRWIFVVISFCIIVSIGYKSKNNEELISVHQKNKTQNQTELNSTLTLKQDQKSEDKVLEEIIEKKFDFNSEDETSNIDIENNNDKHNIYVNKIIISKNIDNDETSDTYRNPIDAFKTITTLDESVVKEINYYPSFFIWSSINTEKISLMNEEQIFKPINLSMIVKCNGQIINNYNYNVTANTPRWREWIEIDLTNISNETLNQVWNIEIVDNTNNNVLESRNFKLINNDINVDRYNELTLEKNNLINQEEYK